MKFKRKLAASCIAASFALLAPSAANAALTYGPSGVCPIDGTFTTDCNLFVTFNADGSISTALGAQDTSGNYTYDNVEDALIGVYNNTLQAISSFSISSTSSIGIFNFEDDGIASYTGVGNAMDNSGYGGENAYFTNIAADLNHGIVNFLTPIAANGGTSYFSLEDAIDVNAPPVIGRAPEPGTLSVLALGLAGLGWSLRRKRSAKGSAKL
jgi:hypothetical protein